MKAFALILLKWSCIILNFLFWSYPITIAFTSIYNLTDHQYHYSSIGALIGSILMIVIGIVIFLSAFIEFKVHLLSVLVIGTILPYIFPMQTFIIPHPVFDEYLVLDSKKNETLANGIVQAGCYKKAKLLKDQLEELNDGCDGNCFKESEVKIIIRRNCFYSYRFAEFRELWIHRYSCFKGSLSESSFIEKVIFPLRIACEQTFFRFLFLFCFLCIPFSIFEFKNSNFWMKFGLPLTPIERKRLFRLSGTLLALILIFNYMYLLELKS